MKDDLCMNRGSFIKQMILVKPFSGFNFAGLKTAYFKHQWAPFFFLSMWCSGQKILRKTRHQRHFALLSGNKFYHPSCILFKEWAALLSCELILIEKVILFKQKLPRKSFQDTFLFQPFQSPFYFLQSAIKWRQKMKGKSKSARFKSETKPCK